MSTPFNKYAHKGNEFLAHLARELNMPNDNKRALHVLKAVLHALRNHVTPDESAQFMAQLPMMLKAVYVDGWQIGKKQPRISEFSELVQEVYELGGGYKGLAFGDTLQAEYSLHIVFKVLQQFISEGEFNDMLANMPPKLREPLLDTLMKYKGIVM